MSLKLFSFLVCLLFLSACSFITGIGKDNAPAPTSLTSIKKPAFKPQLMWSKDAGVGADEHYLKLTPAIADDHIFTIDAKGQVCSYDFMGNNASWCASTKSHPTTGLAVNEDVLVFGTRSGKLYALDEHNGEVRWTSQLPNQSLAVPALSKNSIFVKTIDGDVCALNKITGCRLWTYEHATPVFILRDSSAPQVMRERVIVGFSDGKLAAFNAKTGELIWEKTIATAVGRGLMSQLVDISADPILQQGTLYVVTYQGNIAAINLETGDARWEHPLSSYTGMVITSHSVIVTDADSIVWAFDKTTGCELWKQEKLKYRGITAPTLQGCNVVVGDKKGYVHWMSVLNGEFVARTKVADDVILSPPLVYQNHLFVFTQKGKLFFYTI